MAATVSGKFTYFAYGSNMLIRRIGARVPSAIVSGTGYVRERRLTFNKVSIDGSGKCDIESTANPNDLVYGVLFEINSNEKGELDKAEGLGKGYKEDLISVATSVGMRNAVTYVATEKEASLLPYHWYKAFVIAGAVEHRLPDGYIEWLRTFDSQPDLHSLRRAENESLLFGG